MNSFPYLSHGWNANPVVLAGLAAAAWLYVRTCGRRGRPALFGGALALVALAFLSPLDLLSRGVLFSAHMAQHIILLLLVPALVLLSLPKTKRANRAMAENSGRRQPVQIAIATWMLGVGSMWFWHVPQFCNAAAASSGVHLIQTVSLLGLGTAFWWPILSPRPAARLNPGFGIAYLFTACIACTALGILLTLTPVDVCPIFKAPSTAPAAWVQLRERLTPARDQQIGGLLMWLPMCLVYVAAIVLELARWFGEPRPEPAHVPSSAS